MSWGGFIIKTTIAVISYTTLTSLIKDLNYSYPDSIRIKLVEAILEDALHQAIRMEEMGEADVFVSAGGNAKLLSENLKSPFVEIKVTGFDILLALNKARRYSHRIGVITYQNKIPYLEEILEMLTVSVKQVTYGHLDEVERVLDGLLSEGIRTVVGASLAIEVARSKGMNGVIIYSTDGITRAMDSAVQIALSRKAEAEKAEELRTIIDFAYGGIIATDKRGIITVFNPSAEKITGIAKEKAIGRSIQAILPHTRLLGVMRSGAPELNQLQSIGDIRIVTNRIPIVVNGVVSGAVATFQDTGAIQEAEEKIREKLYEKGFLVKTSIDEILGESELMQRVKRQAHRYAQSDSTVLIMGESGTGKELFAQGIHNASTRYKKPFVAVNCAALPESLLESELFGYEEGAFTGARKGGKPGLFELAHGGTIFLDEVGEMPLPLQSRLLRVLEEREVLRVGGNRILNVNIRVIAATNKDLWDMVPRGLFREDLYYRLNVLELRLPPLRERKSDIPILVTRFLSEMRKDLSSGEVDEIAGNPMFSSYHWPGNVRELKNMVERFAVLYLGGNIACLKNSLFRNEREDSGFSADYQAIRSILKEVRGNRAEAAKRLGISRTTLWRKLKETGLLKQK